MKEKLTFSEKIRKKYRELTDKEDEAILARGRSYNRHFEGWLEYEVTTPKGKTRILRVYDGAWYQHKLSQKQRRCLKLLYLLLFLASAGLFCLAAFQVTGSNAAKYVLVTEALSLIGLIASGYSLVIYMTSPAKMTIGEYKSSSFAIQKAALACTLAFAAAAAATLIHAVISAVSGTGGAVKEFLCALSFAAGGAAIYSIRYIEKKKVKYDALSNKAVVPEGAEKIKDRDYIY